ncbi:cell death-inducing p53-target protein 1 homolog [Halichondria panicea]|uniref:cell death-inducing p53-target protein 1 homolog n=1 Tax=Halichondria panicea TaxID=6063 RepID=UPI00312B7BEC
MEMNLNIQGYPQSQPQQQEYPPDPSYTQQPGYPQYPYAHDPSAPPPPYYPQQQPPPRPIYVQQQQQQNNVVVMQQAAPVTIVRPSIHQSDAGQGALVFAIIITLFALVCGCWWSIVCSIPGIVFASSATNAGARGDYDSVRSNNNLSYGCTVGAIVGAVVGVGSLFGIVFGLSSSSSRTSSCYYSSRYYC